MAPALWLVLPLAFLAVAVAAGTDNSIETLASGELAVTVGVGSRFSVNCPAIPDEEVRCTGPHVHVVDGVCRPVTTTALCTTAHSLAPSAHAAAVGNVATVGSIAGVGFDTIATHTASYPRTGTCTCA